MKKVSFLVAAAICVSTGLLAQGNSLNLKKGQKYLVENKIKTESTTQVQGQDMEVTADVSSTYSILVNDLVDNNYNLTNAVTAVKMNMTQMGQEISFDSEKKEDLDGPMGSALKDFINNPKNIVVDRSGKVVQQKANAKSDSASQAMDLISRQMNFEESGYGSEMAFESLPKDVKTGSTWSNKFDKDGVSKTTNYSVTAVNGNIATIALSGTLATDTKMDMQGMSVSTKTTGKFSGEEKVDIKTGVIQSNTTTTDATGVVSVMGQEFPTSSKVTTTTTVKNL